MISAIAAPNPAPAADSSAPSPRLVKAAHEFEAILLQSWMEKMNQSFVGESGSLDPGHDTMSSLGTQAIAQALSARGGIGIASMILRQIERHVGPAPADPEAAAGPAVNQQQGAGR